MVARQFGDIYFEGRICNKCGSASKQENIVAIHDVKSWSHFFAAIKLGAKVHDLRKNDRNYNVGDVMLYREYDFIAGRFTGNTLEAEITYITDSRTPCAYSSAVLPADYCILSIRVRR